MTCIAYKAGYKYQLVEEYTHQLPRPWRPRETVSTARNWVLVNPLGLLKIKAGYAWDGASGPTLDTPSSMRGSLVHDALYQLIREGLFEEWYRLEADVEAQRIWREDGMWKWRVMSWFLSLRGFAKFAISPKSSRPTLYAGKGCP